MLHRELSRATNRVRAESGDGQPAAWTVPSGRTRWRCVRARAARVYSCLQLRAPDPRTICLCERRKHATRTRYSCTRSPCQQQQHVVRSPCNAHGSSRARGTPCDNSAPAGDAPEAVRAIFASFIGRPKTLIHVRAEIAQQFFSHHRIYRTKHVSILLYT